MCEIDTKCLKNVETLIVAMGDAPCFHDANVIGSTRTENGCEVTVHMFRMTQEIDASGFYKLEKHHLVTLEMSGIREITLPEPYAGDCLSGLSVRCEGALTRIQFGSVMSATAGGHVLCGMAAVARVVPCDPDGVAIS